MVAPRAIQVPIKPDLSKLYEGMAKFHEAIAAGHRNAAEAAETTAHNFQKLAMEIKGSDNPTARDLAELDEEMKSE